ncbi:conserved hypothetical protein [uncultured Gammaproteobacteria bacterium]
MADVRKQILAQITALRAKIDPVVLARVQKVAEQANFAPPAAPRPAAAPVGTIPYDKQAARETVSLFLARANDGGRFRAKLLEALKVPPKR